MISQRKLVAEYQRMLGKIEKKNKDTTMHYHCTGKDCENGVLINVLDNGNVQEELTCTLCRGKMQESDKEPKEGAEPTLEFYRPTSLQLQKKRDKPNLINFILGGGLMLRPREMPKVKNPLEIALDVLRDLPFKKMPTNQEFFEAFVPELKEKLGLLPEKQPIKLIKDDK